MRRLVFLMIGVFVVLVASATAKTVFPETIALPTGFRPEGISIGQGTTFYVGSIPTGTVYRGDLRTGEGSVLVPGVPGGTRAAIGVEFDRGLLYVAGGPTGKAFLYDAESGMDVAEIQLAVGAGATFVNDVVVTKDAAFFTDSRRPVLYRVPLSNDGLPSSTVEILPLGGDFVFDPGVGVTNLNGIEATADGSTLVVVQTSRGLLLTVDPDTGVAMEIDLGGATLPGGDGLLLQGRTLYVVQNRLNQIAVVTLDTGLDSGAITRTITDPDFDVPTTIDRFGNHLYAVNARFGTPSPDAASYSVVKAAR